jgi:hypothetical protein
MKIKQLMIVWLALFLSACSSNNATFYVSPSGDDNNPGTQSNPFASLNRAKEAVLERVKDETENNDIIVYFMEGTYHFDETTVFSETEFGNGNSRIIFSAFENENPVFTAGVKLGGWSKVDSDLPYLPENAAGKIWSTRIPENVEPARFLFNDSGPLVNAVSHGLHTAEDENFFKNINTPPAREQLSSFVFPKEQFREWENLHDIEAVVRPYEGWIMNILPIRSVDFSKNIAHTAIPGTYRISRLKGFWYEKQYNLWVQNAIDFLDEPGEWVINTSEGKIYYWPKEGEPGNVYYPLLKEIIRVEGNQKDNKIIRNIEFRGITFCGGNRDTWVDGDVGIQHDWAFYDKSDALVRFVDTENCVVDECTFINSGGGGIRFDFFSQNNKVVNSYFSRLGGTSVLFVGYGPGGEDVNRNNLIINNEIHDIGQSYWHSPAIFIWQSGGNRIAHNLIYNTPYTGIVISGPRPQFLNPRMKGLRELTGTVNHANIGNYDVDRPDWYRFEPYADVWDEMIEKYLFASDNVVEYNELHNIDLTIDDGNGIYFSGTGLGNIARRNYLHNNTAVFLHGIIRADDQAKDVTITENIIYKFTNEGIKIKHPCIVTNNYIINWQWSQWWHGLNYPKQYFINVSPVGPVIKGTVIENNICYQSEGETEPFFGVSIYYPLAHLTSYSDLMVDNNLYFDAGGDPDNVKKLEEVRANGLDLNTLVADPLFEGFDGAGFRLKSNSPAFNLGIKQIEIGEMGLLKNGKYEISNQDEEI